MRFDNNKIDQTSITLIIKTTLNNGIISDLVIITPFHMTECHVTTLKAKSIIRTMYE